MVGFLLLLPTIVYNHFTNIKSGLTLGCLGKRNLGSRTPPMDFTFKLKIATKIED